MKSRLIERPEIDIKHLIEEKNWKIHSNPASMKYQLKYQEKASPIIWRNFYVLNS